MKKRTTNNAKGRDRTAGRREQRIDSENTAEESQ